jgi:hypothetical protein
MHGLARELPWRGRSANRAGPSLPECRSGSWLRPRAFVCGRGRQDEQYFCEPGIHASVPSAVIISCYLQATTNEPNHKDHEAHKGRTKTFMRTFGPLPYPKSA